jgi:hypothetical protein
MTTPYRLLGSRSLSATTVNAFKLALALVRRSLNQHSGQPWPNKRRGALRVAFGTVMTGGLAFVPVISTSAGAALVRPYSLGPGITAPGASALGPVPATEPLSMTVILPPSNQTALTDLLKGQQDHASPTYHRWLVASSGRCNTSLIGGQ